MANRIDNWLGSPGQTFFSGTQKNTIVITPSNVIYVFHINSAVDPSYWKSTDGGYSWGSNVVLKNCTCISMAVWYDRWTDPSGVLGDLIHVVYTDSAANDTFYRNINTASADSLSAETTVFNGGSTANGNSLSITRAKGGNLICATCIDAGAEYDTVKSVDVGANWTSISEVFEGATMDNLYLAPGFAIDTQDIIALFWDASADEISRKIYDDSGDSWAETSIATSMAELDHNAGQSNFHVSIDHVNNTLILVAWSATDTANADLRMWTVKEDVSVPGDGIVEKTNVVLNSADDQAYAQVSCDLSGNIWVFYAGNSNGSETFATSLNCYYKKSVDNGTTWGSETKLTTSLKPVRIMVAPLIVYKDIYLLCHSFAAGSIYSGYAHFLNMPNYIPRTTYQLGI